MSKKKITLVAEEILQPKLKEKDFVIWNIEFVKEVKDWFLRVYIDKLEGAVSLEDCEEVSRFLSEKLDEVDIIEPNYFLEVSSPGLERVLIHTWHYEKYIGELISLKLYKAYDGKKNFEGKLIDVNEDVLKLQTEDKTLDIEREKIAKANVVFVF